MVLAALTKSGIRKRLALEHHRPIRSMTSSGSRSPEKLAHRAFYLLTGLGVLETPPAASSHWIIPGSGTVSWVSKEIAI
jgi:hypothetical protein